jgi:hexosaminidase
VPKPDAVDFNGRRQKIKAISVEAAEPLQAIAAEVDALVNRNGLEPFVANTGTRAVVSTDSSLSAEGYKITVSDSRIDIVAADEKGFFYALITLLTLRETGAGSIECGCIEDAPRFSWRGQHLDCARHYYQVGTILRLLDLMALLKLNRFHWHISDDEAFRLQTDFASSLWQQTQFRGENSLIPGVFGGGAGPAGGSYSKDDVVVIIAHAKALRIEVMPEIEFPAHALCVNRCFNELRDPHDSGTEESVQGYTKNVVNPALPATLQFFDKLCSEVAGWFPFGHLHLGGDELPEGSWSGSDVMDDFKADHNLASKEDIQGVAMHRLALAMRQQQIVPCAWEESGKGNHGGLGHDAILFLWQGVAQFEQLASQGYRCVLTPAQHTYFDMAHTNSHSDWGANWAATVSLADTISWEPVPVELEQYASQCLGVQGAFWSEFTTEDHQMEAMIAPRILGVACKAWSRKGAVSASELHAMAQAYEVIFNKLQWQTAPANLYA